MNTVPVKKIKALIEKFKTDKAGWEYKEFYTSSVSDSTKAYYAAATLDSVITQLKQLIEEEGSNDAK